MKRLLASFIILLALLSNADAAWTVYTTKNQANCVTCGLINYGNVIFWRIKIVSDGTTLTAAESEGLMPLLEYVSYYLYDITIENPASGGPAAAWNLEVQDTGIQAGATGKTVSNTTSISNTASTDVVIDGSTTTGKFEAIAGRLRLLVDDTNMGNTEYVTILFTMVK